MYINRRRWVKGVAHSSYYVFMLYIQYDYQPSESTVMSNTVISDTGNKFHEKKEKQQGNNNWQVQLEGPGTRSKLIHDT